MIGIKYDLINDEAIYHGADWYKDFVIVDPTTLLPFDLTGYTAEAMARKYLSSPDASITFDITIRTGGIVRIALTNAQTSLIPVGTYSYDIDLSEPTPSTIKHKPITLSIVQVKGEVTK